VDRVPASHAGVVLADRADGDNGHVLPRADQQTARLAGLLGFAMLLHTEEVVNRAAEEDVVPGADVQGGDVEIVVVGVDLDLVPEIAVGGMAQPFAVVGGDIRQQGIPFQGHPVEFRRHVVDTIEEFLDL